MNTLYVLQSNGQHAGPFTPEALARAIVDGSIPRDAFIAQPGAAQWRTAAQTPELASIIDSVKRARASVLPPPPIPMHHLSPLPGGVSPDSGSMNGRIPSAGLDTMLIPPSHPMAPPSPAAAPSAPKAPLRPAEPVLRPSGPPAPLAPAPAVAAPVPVAPAPAAPAAPAAPPASAAPVAAAPAPAAAPAAPAPVPVPAAAAAPAPAPAPAPAAAPAAAPAPAAPAAAKPAVAPAAAPAAAAKPAAPAAGVKPDDKPKAKPWPKWLPAAIFGGFFGIAVLECVVAYATRSKEPAAEIDGVQENGAASGTAGPHGAAAAKK